MLASLPGLRLIIYVEDYLLLRLLVRTAKRMGMTVVNYYQTLPASCWLPIRSEVDLVILLHDDPKPSSFQYYNNLYLTELVYPDLPTLLISDLEAETIRSVYLHRSRLLPVDQIDASNQFWQKVMAVMLLSQTEKTPSRTENYRPPEERSLI